MKDLNLWKKVIIGTLVFVLVSLIVAVTTLKVQNINLERKASNAVKEKFSALEAKEIHWQGVANAYRDSITSLDVLVQNSDKSYDSLLNAYENIKTQEDEADIFVARMDSTDILNELRRIRTTYDLH